MEKIDKKANILEAAEKLFAELGYEATSTRHIAKEAGANMAMINYYFGSKEGVFMEIMSKRIADFNTQLTSITQDRLSGMEKLLKVIEGYASRILCNHGLHKMMHRELSLPHRPEMFFKIKNSMAENLFVIERIINEGIADGSFRQVDVRMLIATLMGTISNVAISPSKITSGTTLDINNEEDRKVITARLITHLKDLIITYLTPKNDT
ncbi:MULTISPECIES: TetR/AcrR family transcriptional regulator [Pedobacter]|uniref:Regulatory protein TetR n=1 Tax=Pedobacter heparinus (strain ATCC 13125 / DSM 2366 / CIP 104194 / JCM 7457 / NBRC 12017 / NCIMB 9290 / NRRL B-14731 / HIM 762-3) TaxID=485917 RepID=C6XXE4_PEDHD|nr:MULTISPECIES: TetR/AcrR family transcriptional regulator [Pedobacter]ACU06450.1 regulatory protein TetR [Pedobacter heparinus DSM 2366]MBB5437180.1 AcrR family transcriptional regulator [Pedobacter sp. AK017]